MNHIDNQDVEAISLSNKYVYFSNLANGLYLVIGNEARVNEEGKVQVYTPQVTLIRITGNEEIPVELKYNKKEFIEDTCTAVHVIKVWKNDIASERPESISVDLLQKDEKQRNYVLFMIHTICLNVAVVDA